MRMDWEHIELCATIDYWVCGIYKITSYSSSPGYYAYYIPDHFNNWGNHPCEPPVRLKNGDRCWKTLASARMSCRKHAKGHFPADSTVKRAAEIVEGWRKEVAEGVPG